MKILVVGGTGFVGGYTALYLHDQGHQVTLMSRSRPRGASRLNGLPFVQGNYIEDDFDDGRLEGFDSLVFCAGNDLGNYAEGSDLSQEEYFEKTNVIGLPRFFKKAKEAGISRAVYMGSFYSFVAPESIDTVPYVRSRHLSDEAIRSLSSSDFNVCSCALPWIVGFVPGLPVPHWIALTQYALNDPSPFSPPGGANFMTCHSVAEAVLGGLERGESGKCYLVGDVNLTWKEFFELWFQAAGRPINLEVKHDEHPIIPREVRSYLSGVMPDYIPPKNETGLLGYQRDILVKEIQSFVDYYRTQI